MKIKLDENLPFRVVPLLKDLGDEAHTVHEERLVGHHDREIWEAAQKESKFLSNTGFGFLRLAAVCAWFPSRDSAPTSSLAEPQEPD